MAKKAKPRIGGKKPKEVEEKKKRVVKKVEPPPAPIPFIDGVANPLVTDTRKKRALAVALSTLTHDDDDLLCECVRQSGMVHKAGLINADLNDAPVLTANELSGRGYALRCGRKLEEEYSKNKPDAVAACMEFAKVLVAACKKGDIDKIREAGMKEFASKKKDLIKAAEKAAKKPDKPKKAKKSNKKKPEKPVAAE